MLIDVQISSAQEWPAVRDAAQQAEADGADAIWTYDHFDATLLGGTGLTLECFTLLGAIAAATTRVGIGPLVANVENRHPSVLAASAATLQRISGGRLRMGVGAGGGPDSPWAREHRERGMQLFPKLAHRHAAVVRQIEVLRALPASITPRIPVLVGVNSTALAVIAGQHADGVNVRLSSPGAATYINAARNAAGNRPFETSGWAHATDDAAREKANELQLDRLMITHLARRSPSSEAHR